MFIIFNLIGKCESSAALCSPLRIGNLEAKIPVVQGGMGIGISLSSLAGAVASEGGVGTISAAQIGFNEPGFEADPLKANLSALKFHIERARRISGGHGILGVNIMTVTKNYAAYVSCAAKNAADLIVSGAGLPLNLPELVSGTSVKIAPIVSSLKAASILLKMWGRRYNTTADLIVVEGPKAGGHLGFKDPKKAAAEDFDPELCAILKLVKEYERDFAKKIPVVFGGGLFTKSDAEHYINLGCAGVQLATPFIVTEECDAHPAYKEAFLRAGHDDILIVNSPVGLPGRALSNAFIEKVSAGNLPAGRCLNCMEACPKLNIPYCISQALIQAARGNIDEGLIFCGESAAMLKEKTTVKEVLSALIGYTA